MTTIYTIGHSNTPVEHLIERLDRHGIAVVVDVRSRPYSRHNPQFNRPELAEHLRLTGRPYVFSGHSLGGMPDDASLLTADGLPDYAKIRASAAYQRELAAVVRGVQDGRLGRVAIMCSEADPSGCHRRRLVGVDLVERGLGLVHVLGDGTLRTEHELREILGENQPSVLDLFGG